jgi:uncharacterized Tic20 family protein
MSKQQSLTQNERTLAALAHSSILLGLLSNGVGGIVAALVIWATQKDKSPYAAAQALQSMAYQGLTFLITIIAWCCWGVLYTLLIMVPLISNPGAYEAAPPAGLWVGLALMLVPLALWGLMILYGLYGAVRCMGGHDFKYAIIGNWLESQR